MIKITEEMRQHSELKRLEEKTDMAILRAASRGESKAIFPLDHTDAYFHPLRELYEKAGYKIVPVGIVGGVMQRDYFIIW
jgi:hypothetical protein